MIPKKSGGYGERVTPVPIPNTEVKPSRADGTWRVTSRQSRSLPDQKSTWWIDTRCFFIFQKQFVTFAYLIDR